MIGSEGRGPARDKAAVFSSSFSATCWQENPERKLQATPVLTLVTWLPDENMTTGRFTYAMAKNRRKWQNRVFLGQIRE